ncbi:MAG: antitermination protein NusG [Verrucomicrobia bacterium]|jgi:transcription antitermination factor NusG|nr:antitermination protein NusG [Verrucomicrobiota bacterium]
MSELVWFVAHTRPRCEKKLADFCQREGFSVTMPLYRSVKKYRGKKVVFEKPLFPGYVFLRLVPEDRRKVYYSDYIANLLDVVEQDVFEEQLNDILLAVESESEIEVLLAPTIQPGCRVRIKSGPLRGVEGDVQNRQGQCQVLLRLDFIGQAAAVKVEATQLELI